METRAATSPRPSSLRSSSSTSAVASCSGKAHRRTDLVRFGLFTGGTYIWAWKGGTAAGAATDAHLNLFPIPATELVANPKLQAESGLLSAALVADRDGSSPSVAARTAGSRLARATLAAVMLLLAASCGGSPASPPRTSASRRRVERPALAQTYRASGHMAAGDVFVHLFEWKWRDIATECEQTSRTGRLRGRAGLAAARAQHHAELRLE